MFSYKKTKYRLDVVFPNKQYGGVYALGPLILYNMVNNREGWYCSRVFSDSGKITAPLVGFTLQYELDVAVALEMKPIDAICFAGGPIVHTYTEEMAGHFDFLILGDVEAVLDKVLDAYEKDKHSFLETIASFEGVYVQGMSEYATYAKLSSLDTAPYPLIQPFPENISEEYVFGKCFLLEIERGCPFRCQFCAIPVFYDGKLQYRSLENINEIIDQGLALNDVEKVVIYAPSFVHPKRKEILQYLVDKKIPFSVPSLKAEHMDEEVLALIKKGGQESVTIAPECGERLRFSCGKNVKDEEYLAFVVRCNAVGIKKIKLYLLLGLPGMEQDDLEEMVALVYAMDEKFNGRLYLSLNYFVPKNNTGFSTHVFDKKKIKSQRSFLSQAFSRFRLKFPSLSRSYQEAVIPGKLSKIHTKQK